MAEEIDTVVFDLGGVLIAWDPVSFVKDMFPTHPELDAVSKAFTHLTSSETWKSLDEGKYSLGDAERLFEESKQYDMELVHVFLEQLPLHLVKLPAGIDLLNRVRRNGYRTFVISNYIKEYFEFISNRFDFFQGFEGIAVSYRLGFSKPRKDIYQWLIETFALNPKKCVFLDDSPKNVDAAIALGMHALVYETCNPISTETKLQAMGLNLGVPRESFDRVLCHYDTDDFVSHAKRIPDDLYRDCLDSLVKACVDIVVLNASTDEVLLGKRRVFPQKDWWWGCGGRMIPGEDPQTAAVRLFKRELGLEILDRSRFKFLRCTSNLWGKREQPPQDHGTADIVVNVVIHLLKEEIAAIRFDAMEYEAQKWEWIHQVNGLSGYHPGLVDGIQEYLLLRRQHQLADLCSQPSSPATDKKIAQVARSIFARQASV